MIARTLKEILGRDRGISAPECDSRRVPVASDGIGLAFTKTINDWVAARELEYLHRFETCYCIEGKRQITAPAVET